MHEVRYMPWSKLPIGGEFDWRDSDRECPVLYTGFKTGANTARFVFVGKPSQDEVFFGDDQWVYAHIARETMNGGKEN